MALSGSITKKASDGRYGIVVKWDVTSQSIETNSSVVRVRTYLFERASWTIDVSSRTLTYTIDGSSSTGSASAVYNMSVPNDEETLMATKSFTVYHDELGNKTMGIKVAYPFSVTIQGTSYGTFTASDSVTLDPIPRVSSISLSSSTVKVGSAITVYIAAASSTFSHQLSFSCGGYSSSVTCGAGTTNYTFTVPTTWAGAITSSLTASASVTCYTITSGSSNIGSVSVGFTISLPNSSEFAPTIGTVSVSPGGNAVANSWGLYIKGISTATAYMSGISPGPGSSIASYSISGAGFTSSGTSMTTGVLPTAGTMTFMFTVTNTHGFSTVKYASISVQNYNPPNIDSMTAVRCDAAGVEKSDGTYIKTRMLFGCTAIGSNALTSKFVDYRLAGGSSWTPFTSAPVSGTDYVFGGGVISPGSAYEVRLTLTDTLGQSSTRTISVGTAMRIISFKKFGTNAYGVSIGKMCEVSNLFDVDMPIRARQGIEITKSGFVWPMSIGGTNATTQAAAFANIVSPGGTITGYLTLNNTPTADAHAATRRFVLDQIQSSIQSSWNGYY